MVLHSGSHLHSAAAYLSEIPPYRYTELRLTTRCQDERLELLHLLRIVPPSAGAGQTRKDTLTAFHPLPASTLHVEGKSYPPIQGALEASRSPPLPPISRSRPQRESNRDIRPMCGPESAQKRRYFSLLRRSSRRLFWFK